MGKKEDSPEKMDLKSMDIINENRNKLKNLFPGIFTESKNEEGETVESIDVEKLKAEIGDFSDLFEKRRERYGMDWPGKKDCMKLIQQPSVATLKPCREESINFDETENLFIEGDNLEVLRLLQKSYYGKVKMIYIDPPYNTGKEFIYPDNFSESLDTYLAYAGLADDEGRKFSTNTPNEGRFHTKWLNMMFPRLYLARNLLREDGVIFISIDDNEVSNLRKLCDEIFGEDNFLAQLSWKTDGNFDNQAKFKKCHEYILIYAKEEQKFLPPPVIDPSVPEKSKLFLEEIINTIVKNGPKNPVQKVILPEGFPCEVNNGVINARNDSWPHYLNDAKISDGHLSSEVTVESGWSSKDLLEQFIRNKCKPVLDTKEQESSFIISSTGAIEVIKKRATNQSHVITTITGLGGPQKASAEMDELNIVFDDYPKPTELIKYLVKMNDGTEFITLDFFSGSCTTAHSILKLNQEEGSKRKFIMVQLPEPCDEKSKAYNAGYKNIADIGKERIRRAIDKIKKERDAKINDPQNNLPGMEEELPDIDLGFKVLKLGRSNFKIWDGSNPDASEEELAAQLEMFVDHIASDATQEDILYELLLKSGYMPTEKIEKTGDGRKKQYFRFLKEGF